MTFELRPAVLWHHGLEAAVSHLLDALSKETKIVTRLTVGGLPKRLDVTTETIAFRSIRELVANARRHAEADNVTVDLGVRDGLLVAEVRDDGEGFEAALALTRARATNHLGLETLTERVDAAGGTIELETVPGRGTTVRFALPLRDGPD
jgi:signal transduction histidine kinase